MKTNETSKTTRELALEWWDKLERTKIEFYYHKYKIDSIILDEQIERIYLEMVSKGIKTNQKQFVQFDADKFKAYISKFNTRDRAIAVRILNDSLPFKLKIIEQIGV